MKSKVVYFFICLGCTLALKNNICTYASPLDTSTTTNDSIYIENDFSNSSATKELENNTVIVSNSDEFIDNLSNGNNIILDNIIELDLSKTFTTDSAISIDTNGYGIKIPSGNVIKFDGPFKFSGGSAANPIFTVNSESLLDLMNSSLTVNTDNNTGIYLNKNSYLSLYKSDLSVNGNNSTGIYLNKNSYLSLCKSNLSVNGNNSIGINSNTEIDDHNTCINFSFINANGNNSIGIKCDKNVYLLYDILTCSGENSVIIDSPKVVLDSCNTDTIFDNATIVNRYVSNIVVSSYQAALNDNKINLPNYVTCILKDKEKSAPDQKITLNVTWHDTADYNTIGEYEIIGDIINPYSTIPIDELIDDIPNTVKTTIYIKDPNILDISYISNVFTFNNLNTIIIEFLKAPLNSDANTLYYSTDNGQTWLSSPNDSYFLIDNLLFIFDLEFNKDYLFQYILSDGVKSNILKVNINPGYTYISSVVEGDRDNGDLGRNKPPLHISKHGTDNNSATNKNSTYEDNNSENSLNADTLNDKNIYTSSSSKKKYTDNNDSYSYSDSSNIYIIDENSNNIKNNDDSNLIIMDTNSNNSTFKNGTLEDNINFIEEKTILSNSNDSNNSIASSNAIVDNNAAASSIGQSNAAYETQSKLNDNHEEDSIANLQAEKQQEAEKKQETDDTTIASDVTAESKEKDINNNSSSINEIEKSSNDSSFKNYIPFIAILASLICITSFLFIKKGKK